MVESSHGLKPDICPIHSLKRRYHMYVYILSEPGLFTVGFYTPDGRWNTDSDHTCREEAARRVAWLNGSERN